MSELYRRIKSELLQNAGENPAQVNFIIPAERQNLVEETLHMVFRFLPQSRPYWALKGHSLLFMAFIVLQFTTDEMENFVAKYEKYLKSDPQKLTD
ncbi:MAG TPA: hypothetical protein PL155_08520 [Candidatus Omnitrophota bacterium]|nr:hypothetical protein [Candidatus Omnitrophota bacterium]HPD85502.1 hypothetical protein [Candidatus Omnitrophota bacterium]HRZ03997.1 hypothetical protein [Candidatus Omnitrophota bacterium]